jgi:hypothetical protein
MARKQERGKAGKGEDVKALTEEAITGRHAGERQ